MTGISPARRVASLRLLESRPAAAGLALALALIGLAPQFLSRTLPDIAFLLHAAGEVLDGARLYVDLLEVNPPLIVWLDLPIVAAARSLGISEITAYRLAVTALLFASVLACRWVLARSEEGRDPAVRRLLLLLVVFALFVLPRLDWGEREHLTLALTLPYVLLSLVRLEGGMVKLPGAIAIGIGAAVGIAIKPHFVLLLLAREGVLARSGSRRGPSPEGWTVVIAGLAYLAAAATLTPEYFALARELGTAYHQFIRNPLLVTALLGDGAALTIGALLLAVGLWSRSTRPLLRTVLVAAVLAFYVAAVVQSKGWRYHFYPALALAWILLVLLAVRLDRPLARWTQRLFAAAAGAGAAVVGLVAVVGCLLQAARPLDPRYDADPSLGLLLPVLREHARGRELMMLSPNMASGFPLAMYLGARWPQRLSNLWPLVAAYDSAIASPSPLVFRDPERRTALERRVLDIVAEDFERTDAPLLLVLRTGPDEPKWGMRRLDLLAFLSQDRRIARRLADYERAGPIGQYELYYSRAERTRPPPALPPLFAAERNAPDTVRIASGGPAAAVLFAILVIALYRREPADA